MTSPTPAYPASSLARAALVAAGGAALANIALTQLAVALGVPMTGEFIPGQVTQVPLFALVMSAVVPTVVAAIVLAVLARRLRAPARAFAITAVVVLLASFASPFTLGQSSFATRMVLELMHVIEAAIVTASLLVLGRGR